MGSPSKACAVVIRSPDAIEVLAFEHPLAGFQLVKGTIEGGETPQQAAVRELREEAGFEARAVEDLGEWDSGYMGQIWSLQLCAPLAALPEHWIHHALDDGGHDFRFFWHPLSREPAAGWHEVYVRVLERLKTMSFNRSVNADAQGRQPAARAPHIGRRLPSR
jgi:8-oxo-dGTP pyrophosphatase MutT (NUDIX family)